MRVFPERYDAGDKPTSVIESNTRIAPRLMKLSTLPFPSSASRVSVLKQRIAAIASTEAQANALGNPGYRPMADKKFCGGCPAGIHQGIIGVTPATNTNVSTLRVTQPFTLCWVFRRTR